MARVGVLQMTSSSHVIENLDVLRGFFIKANDLGIRLLILPENCAYMGKKDTDKQSIAETFGSGPIQDTISQLAQQYAIWVVAGTIPLKTTTDKVSAASLVYDETGRCVARYDKIHLFDVHVSAEESHQESMTTQRGTQVVSLDTPVGRIGLSVCYDLRFPELYRQLVLQGAEILVVPAAFTAITGAAHWDSLLRARAIENLCYVLAANQGGLHASGRQTYGHSMIIDPWGKMLCEQKNGAGLQYADIDLQRLKQLRRQFPSNDHHVLS